MSASNKLLLSIATTLTVSLSAAIGYLASQNLQNDHVSYRKRETQHIALINLDDKEKLDCKVVFEMDEIYIRKLVAKAQVLGALHPFVNITIMPENDMDKQILLLLFKWNMTEFTFQEIWDRRDTIKGDVIIKADEPFNTLTLFKQHEQNEDKNTTLQQALITDDHKYKGIWEREFDQ